jgi:hypothetical protein
MTSPRPEAVGMPKGKWEEFAEQAPMVADTPSKIRMFQLISAKHAIGLEAKGLRHSRLGRNGLKRLWAKHYGLPPRTKHIVIITKIQEEIEALYTKIHQLPLPLEEPKS